MDADPDVQRAREQLQRTGSAVHLMGIGGVGMAGVAIHLASRGYRVSGCDTGSGGLIDTLRSRGIPIEQGHAPAHLDAFDGWVVHTAAIRPDHAELVAARNRGLPVLARGPVLAALLDGQTSIAVSGTHGKTTTTAMMAQVLRACGCDAGFAIGAEVDVLGGVAAAGRDPVLVVEADESDGTVAGYDSEYAVVTNAELDHVDHFGSVQALCGCLSSFCARARRAAIVCGDDPVACLAAESASRVVTYGFASGLQWRALQLREEGRSVSFRAQGPGGESLSIVLPVPGRHNVLNALAAIAVATDLGYAPDGIAQGLARFGSARRRFELVASANGIDVISDYAHHPTEVRALLSQARRLKPRRILAVFQPHRYSRTRAFASGFADAFSGVDRLVLAPVYAASEPEIVGGRSRDVFPLFAMRHAGRAILADSLEDAWERVRADAREGDLILIVGAGDVEKMAVWAREQLQAGRASPT